MQQRDLSSHDVWEESLRRSRERRARAAAQRQRVELPTLPGRGLTVAAAIALTGGTTVALASNDGWHPASKSAGGKAGGAPPAVELQPVAKRIAPEPSGQVAAAPEPPQAEAKETVEERVAVLAEEVETSTRKPAAPQKAVAATTSTSRPAGGVAALQRKVGATADGDFGAGTERALKRWQREHGLDADGVAGPETRKALGLGDGPVLKREKRASSRGGSGASGGKRGGRNPGGGSGGGGNGGGATGGGVEALQRALGVTADGVFGPGTEQALKSWQREHGLAADGVAGPQTRRALGLGPGPLLKRKTSGGGGSDRSSSVVARVVAAANAIATKPYRYGGGHGSFVDSGYDCSGSISYALHGGGLLSSPLDSTGFMSWGRPGPGKHITVYAHSGHAYMVVDGRRFDTSARWETGSRWSSTQRSSAGYVARHPAGL